MVDCPTEMNGCEGKRLGEGTVGQGIEGGAREKTMEVEGNAKRCQDMS